MSFFPYCLCKIAYSSYDKKGKNSKGDIHISATVIWCRRPLKERACSKESLWNAWIIDGGRHKCPIEYIGLMGVIRVQQSGNDIVGNLRW